MADPYASVFKGSTATTEKPSSGGDPFASIFGEKTSPAPAIPEQAPAPAPKFNTIGQGDWAKLNAGIGIYGGSNIADPYSGKPELTYENPQLQESQLLSDRTWAGFDPLKPQKIDRSTLKNGRMPEEASQKIKSMFPGSAADELDHIMPLEAGGSNESANLRLEPFAEGSRNTATDPIENQLTRKGLNGEMSFYDVWKGVAQAKGLKLPEESGGPYKGALGVKSPAQTILAGQESTINAPQPYNFGLQPTEIKMPGKNGTTTMPFFEAVNQKINDLLSPIIGAISEPAGPGVPLTPLNLPTTAMQSALQGAADLFVKTGVKLGLGTEQELSDLTMPILLAFNDLGPMRMSEAARKLKFDVSGAVEEAAAPAEVAGEKAPETVKAPEKTFEETVTEEQDRIAKEKAEAPPVEKASPKDVKTIIGNIKMQTAGLREAIDNNPASQLWKYANKTNKELPEMVGGKGKGAFARFGDTKLSEIYGYDVSEDQVLKDFNSVVKMRAELSHLKAESSRIRKEGATVDDLQKYAPKAETELPAGEEKAGVAPTATAEPRPIPEDPSAAVSALTTNPEAGFIDPAAMQKMYQDWRARVKEEGITERNQRDLREMFTADRDVRQTRGGQTAFEIKRLLPNETDRQALYDYREYRNDPQGLKQIIEGTHPIYDEAAKWMTKDETMVLTGELDNAKKSSIANTTRFGESAKKALAYIEDPKSVPEEFKKADSLLTNLSKSDTAEMRKEMKLGSNISDEEYNTHLMLMGQEDPSISEGRPKTNIRGGKMQRAQRAYFGKERVFKTMREAMAFGKEPATMDAATASMIHSTAHSVAYATESMLSRLKDDHLAFGGNPDDAPADWVKFDSAARGSRIFQHNTAFIGEDGKPYMAYRSWYVPKWVADAFKPVLEPDTLMDIPYVRKIAAIQGWLKSVNLSLSTFHIEKLTLAALGDMSPNKIREAWRMDLVGPETERFERLGAQFGVTTSILGEKYKAYEGLAPKNVERASDLPTRQDIIEQLPGVKQIEAVARKITEVTFEEGQRRYKIGSVAQQYSKWILKNPMGTDAEFVSAMRKARMGDTINAIYGGLHWENLGVTRNSLRLARLFFLAPDWTYSNIQSVKAAFRGGPAGVAARTFWAKSFIYGMAATEALSLAISGKLSKNPTMVYLGKNKQGKDEEVSVFFAGAPQDLVNLASHIYDYGIIEGPMQSLASKISPLGRPGLELLNNRNFVGNPIVPKGMNPLSASVTAVKNMSDSFPMPFSISTPLQMYFSKEKYSVPQYLMSTIFAARPRNVVPSGMRVVTSGKKKGQVVPDKRKQLNWWDQIITGKVYQTKQTKKKKR